MRPSRMARSSAIPTVDAEVFPTSAISTMTFSMGNLACLATASMILIFAWWGTNQSISLALKLLASKPPPRNDPSPLLRP